MLVSVSSPFLAQARSATKGKNTLYLPGTPEEVHVNTITVTGPFVKSSRPLYQKSQYAMLFSAKAR